MSLSESAVPPRWRSPQLNLVTHNSFLVTAVERGTVDENGLFDFERCTLGSTFNSCTANKHQKGIIVKQGTEVTTSIDFP